MALAFEYKIKVYKINDIFLSSKDTLIMFRLDEDNINWKINNSNLIKKFIYKLFLKILIPFIHFFCNVTPPNKSYKIGSKNNYPSLINGNYLKENSSVTRIIREAKNSNVAVCGWGLRDWKLVSKHKKTIIKNIKCACGEYLNIQEHKNKYLFVHIRRSDFLEVEEFKDLNFSDDIWIKSILNICSFKSIKKVVIFSDELIKKFFILSLKTKGLEVIIPENENKNLNFNKIFFKYIYNASYILCNSSSLVLSIAFLSHESIYLPCRNKEFIEILLSDAHISHPTNINWK
tara:strand:- start:4334 stop:5200 length:867 start_codon:yes stop_codon:yes gene_type:complete